MTQEKTNKFLEQLNSSLNSKIAYNSTLFEKIIQIHSSNIKSYRSQSQQTDTIDEINNKNSTFYTLLQDYNLEDIY